jgi:hypothetical protein
VVEAEAIIAKRLAGFMNGAAGKTARSGNGSRK